MHVGSSGPGIKPVSSAMAGRFFTTEPPEAPPFMGKLQSPIANGWKEFMAIFCNLQPPGLA